MEKHQLRDISENGGKAKDSVANRNESKNLGANEAVGEEFVNIKVDVNMHEDREKEMRIIEDLNNQEIQERIKQGISRANIFHHMPTQLIRAVGSPQHRLRNDEENFPLMAKTERESISSLSHQSESPNVATDEDEDAALLLEEELEHDQSEGNKFVNSEFGSGEKEDGLSDAQSQDANGRGLPAEIYGDGLDFQEQISEPHQIYDTTEIQISVENPYELIDEDYVNEEIKINSSANRIRSRGEKQASTNNQESEPEIKSADQTEEMQGPNDSNGRLQEYVYCKDRSSQAAD